MAGGSPITGTCGCPAIPAGPIDVMERRRKNLATSGADTVIMWPFASKDGPMGKEPAMLAPLQSRVTVVACHPRQDILAAAMRTAPC